MLLAAGHHRPELELYQFRPNGSTAGIQAYCRVSNYRLIARLEFDILANDDLTIPQAVVI